MKIEKALKRDKKFHKNKHGMRVGGRSVFVIVEVLMKKAKKKKGAG
jgi:hypothetical protein